MSAEEVASIAVNSMAEVIQTSGPVEETTWELLNAELFTARPDIQLRVFGFCGSNCDLAFLQRMSNIRRFAADCLLEATGIEHVACLDRLESLSVGIFNLKSFDLLDGIAADALCDLALHATESKRPSLGHLSRFGGLMKLYIEGPHKEIQAVSKLPLLEDLTLRSIGSVKPDFLRGLTRLWSLDIKLGGTRGLSGLADLNRIKYLELWQIKGLESIDVISTLLGLQYLFLQDLPNVTHLPDLSRLTALRRIDLQNMRGLKDVRALASAPALTEFMQSAITPLSPQEYGPLFQAASLRRAAINFGNEKQNAAFREMAAAHDVGEFRLEAKHGPKPPADEAGREHPEHAAGSRSPQAARSLLTGN